MSDQPVIRLTRPNDINTLKTLDLKTHQYPMPLKEWQKRIEGSGKKDEARIILCEVLNVPAGFGMWKIDFEHNFSHLLRLGVLAKFRLHGLGRLMVQACVRHSFEQGCEKVKIVVPDVNCNPGDPDDVSVFLSKCEFQATGEIIHEWRRMYGKSVDGYIFERPLHVTL